jgi:hypothetical protein
MDADELFQKWRKIAMHCNGVCGPVANEYDLGYIEATILGWIRFLSTGARTKKIEHNGKQYVWVQYQAMADRYPMMGSNTPRTIGRYVALLESKGLLERFDEKTVMKTKVHFHIPEHVEHFLFPDIQTINDLERLCKEWVAHKTGEALAEEVVEEKGEEMVDLFAKAEDSKPAKALSEDFLWFLHELKGKTKFSVNRYDKDGKPFKTVLKLQEMYEALLDGSFVQKFAPASKTYDFSTIGPVTEAEILKVAASAPDYIDTINTLIIHYKTKRSELLESVHRIRNYTPPVKKWEAPDPEDKNFAGFVDIVKQQNPNFKWDEERLAGAWNIHKWYKENYKDVQEMNTKDQKGDITAGLYKMGTSFGSFTAKNRTWIPRFEDFHVDSKFWKSYAAFSLKFRGGVKILLDEGFYRRKAKEEVERELLYESRTIEEELGNGEYLTL